MPDENLRRMGDGQNQCEFYNEMMADFIHTKRLGHEMDRHSASAFNIAWVMLAFSLFGILSNSLSLRIFTGESMRKAPVNVMLAALSCIDLFLSVFVIPLFVAPPLHFYYRWGAIDQLLVYVQFALYPLALMTQTASVWVFLIITCERWVAVCRPLQARRYSSVTAAKRAIATVCTTAIIYNLIRFGEFRLVVYQRPYSQQNLDFLPPDCSSNATVTPLPVQSPTQRSQTFNFTNFEALDVGNSSGLASIHVDAASNAEIPTSLVLEPSLRYNMAYMYLYYFGLYLMTHFAIPFSVLLLVNFHVIWTILQARTQRRQLTMHERREHRIALMMGVIVMNFLICNTIPFAMNLLEAYDRDYFRRVETLYIANLLNDVGNLLVVVNSSTTSFIYYAFSQRYRRRCHSKLCCAKPKRHSSVELRNRFFKGSFRGDKFDAVMDFGAPFLVRARYLSQRRAAMRLSLTDSL